MSHYLTVTCRLPADAEERLAQALERWPVLGCQVEDAGSDVDVTVFLEEGENRVLARVREDLRALGGRDLSVGSFADQDWLLRYRLEVSPIAVGQRFWFDPHPAAPTPPPPGRLHLFVEPRQAFGTGSHESTQLVLLLLEEMAVAGRRVLDVGTGSGILCLAATALGAASAVGFDIDLDAVIVARQTVAVQRQALPVLLFAGSVAALRGRRRFDLVLANLIPAQLEPLLPAIRRVMRDDATLIVSGLMVDQCQALAAELERFHLRVEETRELGEWAAFRCRSV